MCVAVAGRLSKHVRASRRGTAIAWDRINTNKRSEHRLTGRPRIVSRRCPFQRLRASTAAHQTLERSLATARPKPARAATPLSTTSSRAFLGLYPTVCY